MFDINQLLPSSESNSFEHTQQQFEKEYGNGFIDTPIPTTNDFFGYDELFFGNDPLIKASSYECQKFQNLVWVEGYVKDDGTVVKGHYRTMPDGTTANNLSSK